MIPSHYHRTMTLKLAHQALRRLFVSHGEVIQPDTWQGRDVSALNAARMVELLNVTLHLPTMHSKLEYLRNDCFEIAAIDWAEAHFAERVCGAPINPGIEWANWPDGASAANFLDEHGRFNHNYMERYWPRYAGKADKATKTAQEWLDHMKRNPHHENTGISGERYGDLEDLVDLLERDPTTRQAYMPIYFPEDTGAEGRKPCTLGYHFILRDEKLHVYYPMRSCDFYRHWGDDCYLTIRLAMWILSELRVRNPGRWAEVKLGSFTMHCTSLHMFYNDYLKLEQQA